MVRLVGMVSVIGVICVSVLAVSIVFVIHSVCVLRAFVGLTREGLKIKMAGKIGVRVFIFL